MINLLRKIKRYIVNIIKLYISVETHKKRESRYVKKDKICVVFITQYIPAWDKVKTLYEELRSRDNVDVHILCVPDTIEDGNLIDPNGLENSTFEYFNINGYDAINALIGRKKWYDLKQLNPDCVFHCRPYNGFMPKPYKSYNVSKYARVCQILYGTSISIDIMHGTHNFDFFKDVYCYYAFGIDEKKYVEMKYKSFRDDMLQHVKLIGSPILENMYKSKELAVNNYCGLSGNYSFIWTPRWCTDKEAGGSNFLNYNKILVEYFDGNKNANLIIRPHPLMFSNFEKTGELSREEQMLFREFCQKSQNVKLDEMKSYIDNFWSSDALITDFSSILYEYFITAKPIIYCHSNLEVNYVYEAKRILEVCYNAYNADDLINHINNLNNGYDPLKKKREAMVEELFGMYVNDSSSVIADDLLHYCKN